MVLPCGPTNSATALSTTPWNVSITTTRLPGLGDTSSYKLCTTSGLTASLCLVIRVKQASARTKAVGSKTCTQGMYFFALRLSHFVLEYLVFTPHVELEGKSLNYCQTRVTSRFHRLEGHRIHDLSFVVIIQVTIIVTSRMHATHPAISR